jgi:hypothetical protein
MATLTLDIAQDLYQRASKAADLTHQSIEQVVIN